MPARTAVAMSGGGHRACVFALGAVMYLADAGRTSQITSVASVSGGSLANGAIAQDLDLKTCTAAEVEATAARVAGVVARRGTVFGWRVTRPYLAALGLLALLVLVGPWFLPFALGLRIAVLVAGLLLLGWVAAQRGRVGARAFGHTVYTRDGRRPPLADVHTAVDHVICATDLHAGEHVYFSGAFVYSYRFGLGTPGDLPLETAVQASAAFPGVFPVTWIRTDRFGFEDGRPEASGTGSLALADGGVYDNMGDQWAQGLENRAKRLGPKNPGFGEADELVVISAAAGLEWRPTRRLALPLAGEVLALVRDVSVLYDNGNSLRRRELVARFDLAEREGKGLRGSLVHIPQSPFDVPDRYASDPLWPERAGRARAALAALTGGAANPDPIREEWATVAKANAAVATTLVAFDRDVTARLLHHAYVLTMVNLHVILDYPLLPVPDRARFDALVA